LTFLNQLVYNYLMKRKQGRPKSFDEHEILTSAMNYFWHNGYDNSSLDDLLKVMNISKGSFYNTYHSKEELFTKTLKLYRKNQMQYLTELENRVGAKKMMLQLVSMTIEELKNTGRLTGCLLINSGKECYGRYDDLSERIKLEYITMQTFLATAVAEAQKKGKLTDKLAPEKLSIRFMNTLNGLVLSVQAGATQEMIENIVEQLREMLD